MILTETVMQRQTIKKSVVAKPNDSPTIKAMKKAMEDNFAKRYTTYSQKTIILISHILNN